jgi:NADP-dependent 3-hydroxy acid dehydrogenase YdfG
MYGHAERARITAQRAIAELLLSLPSLDEDQLQFVQEFAPERLRQELVPDVRVILIEPGVVATELPNHITHDETRQGVQAMYSKAEVTADDMAEVIAFTLSRPRHLAINEILLRPAGQV